MILAFMVYSLAVGTLVALAGWLAERGLASLGRARRTAWMAGIVLTLAIPVAALRPSSAAQGLVAVSTTAATNVIPGQSVGPRISGGIYRLGETRLAGATIDEIATAVWVLSSGCGLAYFLAGAGRLARRARAWPAARIDQRMVAVAPDLGPAVFGWRRPRVVLPAWLMSAPTSVQRSVLAHEFQHLAARDPQVLTAATVLGALFPWNPALLWMLRRLRFALEVDCDARVLRGGADARDYGMALLYVSERQARAPATAIALVERTSQLERRIDIMFSSPRELSVAAAGLCLALAGTCLVAATALDAPRVSAAAVAVLKPPPGSESMGFKLGQHFERHLQEKYPELMGGNFEGMPMIVVLVNPDWSIEKSVKTQNPDPKGDVSVTNDIFELVGLAPAEAPYVGAMHMQMAPGKVVAMVYTERVTPGERFVSSLFTDTRKQDRELFEQNFPGQRAIPPGQNPWVLLDRSGKVVRKGIDAVTPEWHTTLEQRYRGIDTQEVTATPLTLESGEPMKDVGGREVQLMSVWLAPGSSMPAD